MNLNAIQRLTQEFTKDCIPPFPCPSCGDPLRARADGLQLEPSAESQFHYDNEGDPTMLSGIFALRLVCANSSCDEPAICVGSFRTTTDTHISGETVYPTMLTVEFFTPTIHIFPLPAGLQERIRKHLLDSFSAFWGNPSAAGNSLRISVEALMDWQSVKKWTIGKNGKEVEIPLHHRIEDFKKRSPIFGDKLLAIKWLGNSGSHLTGLTRNDVLDGYSLYSYVLEEMFEKRTENLAKLAKKINRRKGRPG